MPKSLRDRLAQDSVHSFERAAAARVRDADALKSAGHGLAAIYLYGYAVEMNLKSAFFRVVGYTVRQPIAPADRRSAVALMQQYVGAKITNHHHLIGWATLLVQHRASPAVNRPLPAAFSQLLLAYATDLYSMLWSEEMRYSQNCPYHYETRRVAEIAHWFGQNYPIMRG